MIGAVSIHGSLQLLHRLQPETDCHGRADCEFFRECGLMDYSIIGAEHGRVHTAVYTHSTQHTQHTAHTQQQHTAQGTHSTQHTAVHTAHSTQPTCCLVAVGLQSAPYDSSAPAVFTAGQAGQPWVCRHGDVVYAWCDLQLQSLLRTLLQL